MEEPLAETNLKLDQELEILRNRARRLARVSANEVASSAIETLENSAARGANADFEVVEFLVAGQHFALETVFLREVTSMKELTSLPGTPAWIRGIVNVRSQILAVVDLRPFFNLPTLHESPSKSEQANDKASNDKAFSHGGSEATNPATRAQLLILQSGPTLFGLVIEQLLGTRLVRHSALQDVNPLLLGGRSEWIRGVTDERLVLLNGARLIDDDLFLVNDGL